MPRRFCYLASSRSSRKARRKMIHIDEFRKIDLRVGVVKSAEAHPNADKLLVLKVDLGAEERQIVAGIRAHYQPEALVGKQVVIVANLETAVLRGMESQGMLLAASDGNGVVFLTPEKTVSAGAKVS
ncbi:MAG: methionine--tRNA ligase subunit beta [Candidatus Binatia bacterium]